ncbi:hypothetical protein [Zhihengliuella sp.]|uniref:hypothetical protein n=1 Tax=Zhihengliuella sp. TaxID=1954483 RepID=UPI002810F3F1|nr:hypothetical protein [Zhihengliuella sp.]
MSQPFKFVLLQRLTILSGVLYTVSHLIGLPGAVYAALVITEIDSLGALAPDPSVQAMAIAGAVTSLLLTVAVYVAVVVGLVRRRNWARIVGVVCAVASIVLTVRGLLHVPAAPVTDGLGNLALILDLVAVPVNAYWLVLALSREVSEYLRRSRPASL